jgi:Spy/CpxP family protein refolding chaperone
MMGRSMAVAAVVLGLALSPVLAGEGPCSGKGKGEGMHGWAKMGLTDQQKTDLKGLREEAKGLHKTTFEKTKAVRDKIKAEMLKTSPDQNVLNGYADELGQIEKEVNRQRFAHLLKVKAILTPEQFQKLLDMGPPMEGGPGMMCPRSERGECPKDGPGCSKEGKGKECPKKAGNDADAM